MLTLALIAIAILLILAVFILFDDPKPHNWRELGKYSPLYKSSLRDNYPSEAEVFQTLKEAGIEPCFLDIDLRIKNVADTSSIQLNNASKVIKKLQKCDDEDLETHLVMVEKSACTTIKLTDENIHNYSNFMLNLWD